MKKRIAFTMMLMMISVSTAAVFGAEYTDVKQGNWAFDAVNAMSEKAIIKGYPDGSFRPDNTVTYGEFIKMALVAGTGADAGNASSGHWAMNYYNKALELKYFTGHDIDKSQLGDGITRGDMALIIGSILGDLKIENYDKIQKGITDITYRTEHEYDITKSYAAGILTGYSDKTFRPDKTLTRAESAAVIYRLVDESKRELPGVSDGKTTGGAMAPGSAITYPTSGLLDMSKLTPDKTIAVSVHFTDTYELYTDASVWDIKMFRPYNGESCAFDHTLRGYIYLVKDSQIVEYCNTTPMFDEASKYLGFQRSGADYDIRKADYIICVPSDAKSEANDLIKAVVNPFKQ